MIFHTNVFKSAAITALCGDLGLQCRVCTAQEEHLPIGCLAGMKIDAKKNASYQTGAEPLSEEMLVLCGIEDKLLDELLKELRGKGLGVSLKAVLTATNASWSAQQLCCELTKEREAYKALSSQ